MPHGSGLGTSSILAAAILAALYELRGFEVSPHGLVHAVLIVEQMLTTGGGWQVSRKGGFGVDGRQVERVALGWMAGKLRG